MNKTIKLEKNLELNIKYENNSIDMKLLDRKTGLISMKTIELADCMICKSKYIAESNNHICNKCDQALSLYNNLNKETTSSLTNIGNIKKHRKHKTIVNYNKGLVADKDIQIVNLVELHNLVSSDISIGRLETLLRFAISGRAYEYIAKKLNVQVTSIYKGYLRLAKAGIVLLDKNQARVNTNVIYTIKETNNTELDSKTISYNKSVRSAHKILDKYLTHWRSKTFLKQHLQLAPISIDKYISVLIREGSIEKRGNKPDLEYRLKQV